MICFCHQKSCFDFYNQIRKRGIKFGRFYVLKEFVDKADAKVLFLGKTAKETILLNVKYEIIAKVLKKLARIVFLNVDQLRFLKKVAFGKIKFKSKLNFRYSCQFTIHTKSMIFSSSHLHYFLISLFRRSFKRETNLIQPLKRNLH
jgi:hypothetical protein